MDLFYGFLLGVAGSLVVWWAINRYLSPRILISNALTVVPTSVHSWGNPQRFKVMNSGRWRGLAEVRAVARLRIKGLDLATNVYPNSRLTFDVALSSIDSCVDFIGPREGWIFTLDPQQLESPYVVFLPDSIRKSIDCHECSIRDLLTLGSQAELEVFVSATDAYSGTRRTQAKTYRLGDVVDGYFVLGSLDVIESDGDDVPPTGH